MDNKILDRIEKVSEQFGDKLKYLYMDHIVGHASAVLGRCIKKEDRVNPIPEEYFDAVINGLINSFYGGCEPEFENEHQLKRWEKGIEYLKSCKWTLPNPNALSSKERHSPYRDQTIPFLVSTIKFEV